MISDNSIALVISYFQRSYLQFTRGQYPENSPTYRTTLVPANFVAFTKVDYIFFENFAKLLL